MPRNDVEPPRGVTAAAPAPAERGLDGLNFFVANIQTGFGPFIAVYLTTAGWTQAGIGVALSLGTITAMASQVPAGALVDAISSKSRVALFSILAFTLSALLLALWPIPLAVFLAEILHGFSSCTLGPAIAALSLAIAGPVALGMRLGRNARFASIGNGVGAAVMGACGYYFSNRSVFFATAVLTLPALMTLRPLRRIDARPEAPGRSARAAERPSLWRLLADRRLAVFALCALLFTFANAAMLPLASSAVTQRAGSGASLLVAACIVLPQVMVAALSPTLGRLAGTRGRRLVLVLAFAMLPLRGALFAVVHQPLLLVLIQALDGVSAAGFGIMVPLICSDVAGRTSHFNLTLGIVGFAIGIGATLSTTIAGAIADHLGEAAAFVALGGVGLAALAVVWLMMPETRPEAADPGDG